MSSTVNKRRSIKRFGKKLHKLRTSRGITLQDLAEALGFKSHGYISELEAGKKLPTVDFVLQVARYFDVTTDELLKDEVKLKERS